MKKSAVISDCGKYRYKLTRRWGGDVFTTLFIMLNPSTADMDKDDPTIRRCINFTKYWGGNVIEIVNLFSYRTTNPENLKTIIDPVGPRNKKYIFDALKNSGIVICAWGGNKFGKRQAFIMRTWFKEYEELYGDRINPHALGITKEGYPRHPLYLKKRIEPVPFIFND